MSPGCTSDLPFRTAWTVPVASVAHLAILVRTCAVCFDLDFLNVCVCLAVATYILRVCLFLSLGIVTLLLGSCRAYPLLRLCFRISTVIL